MNCFIEKQLSCVLIVLTIAWVGCEGDSPVGTPIQLNRGASVESVAFDAQYDGVEFDGKGIIRTTADCDGRLPVMIEAVVLAKSAEGEQSIVSNCQEGGFCLSTKGGAWTFFWHDGSKYKTLSSPIVLEKRTHLLGIVENGRMELWVDGVSQGITPIKGHRASKLPFCIAADPKVDLQNKYDLSGFEFPFSGVVYECRLSNDPNDIQIARLGYVEKKSNRALFHYVFNQGGEMVQDRSSNNRAGTIENGTWVRR